MLGNVYLIVLDLSDVSFQCSVLKKLEYVLIVIELEGVIGFDVY